MKTKKIIQYLALGLFLSALTACDSGDSGTTPAVSGPHACTIPCLESAPLLSTNTLTSTTDGIVSVTFTLRGDFTQVTDVFISLDSTSGSLKSAGTFWLFNPTQATNTVDIPVYANTTSPSETYYPYVVISSSAPVGFDTSIYDYNFFTPSPYYLYTESLWAGGLPIPVSTNFTVPILAIQ